MNKANKKTWIYRFAALAAVLLVAAAMFIIGRGHTVYFDNKMPENVSGNVEVPYSIEVRVNGEKVSKLKDGDRGMAETMGQNFKMELYVTKEKGGKTSKVEVGMTLPYNMDGIILNLPAMLAGMDESQYLTEFIPTPSSEDTEDEEVVTDDTEGLMDFGE